MEHENAFKIIIQSALFGVVFGVVFIIKKIFGRKNGNKARGNIIVSADEDFYLQSKGDEDALSEMTDKALEDAKYMLRVHESPTAAKLEQEPWEKTKKQR